MSTLKKLFRRIWDAYPKEPLVYLCSHNGVTGVVRAEDFDDEVRRMRRLFVVHIRCKGEPQRMVRPQVYPVFLFSDKTPSSRSFRVGTLDDLKQVLKNCVIEPRIFEVPPMNIPGFTPFGYLGMMEEVGRENSRLHIWTLEQARAYLYGVE